MERAEEILSFYIHLPIVQCLQLIDLVPVLVLAMGLQLKNLLVGVQHFNSIIPLYGGVCDLSVLGCFENIALCI